jgi:hypothetical protein
VNPRQTFVSEAWTALAVCLVAAALATVAALAFGENTSSRLAVAAIGLFYLLRAVARRRVRTGHVAAVALWALSAGLAWPFAPALAVYAGVHVGSIWLARAAFTYRSLTPALLDFGLCAVALAAAVWAGTRTESFAIAAWCFCLIQALHVAIPSTLAASAAPGGSRRAPDPGTRFERARRAAEGALERLANT